MKTKFTFLALLLFACHEDVTKIADVTPPLENYVSFSTPNQFFSTIDKIGKMTEKELNAWEAANNFKSYRSVLNDANKEWSAMNDLNQVPLFEEKYKDILTIEDNGISPRIKVGTLQSIVNREGIYETDGYLNKIARNNIYTVAKSESEKLNAILPEEEPCPQLERIAQSGVTVFQYTYLPYPDPCSDPPPPPPPPTLPHCSLYMEDSYFANASKCSDDREVFLSANSYLHKYTGLREVDGNYSIANYTQAYINIKAWGRIRNWLCNWSSYETRLDYVVWSLEINAHRVLSTNDSGTTSEVRHFTFDPYAIAPTWDDKWIDYPVPVGDLLINEDIQPFAFTKLYTKGKSRGTGANGWAIINCQ